MVQAFRVFDGLFWLAWAGVAAYAVLSVALAFGGRLLQAERAFGPRPIRLTGPQQGQLVIGLVLTGVAWYVIGGALVL
jgi:hypothetical protein